MLDALRGSEPNVIVSTQDFAEIADQSLRFTVHDLNEASRPAGLEADRLGKPLPEEHPYFKAAVARGDGRTRWSGPGQVARKPEPGAVVLSLLLAEETAYWDRGVMVANPGPGLPEGSAPSPPPHAATSNRHAMPRSALSGRCSDIEPSAQQAAWEGDTSL